MLDRRLAVKVLLGGSLLPYLLMPLPSGADPEEDDDTPEQGQSGENAEPDEDIFGDEDDEDWSDNKELNDSDLPSSSPSAAPLGTEAAFRSHGVTIALSVLSCAPVPGFTPTISGGTLWAASLALHRVLDNSSPRPLPDNSDVRAFYGPEPFQYYYPQNSWSLQSLAPRISALGAGQTLTETVQFMADRGPVSCVGLYPSASSAVSPLIRWAVPSS